MNDYAPYCRSCEKQTHLCECNPPEKTLRDEFAMAALTGFLAGEGVDHLENPYQAARISYDFADAMMAERDK